MRPDPVAAASYRAEAKFKAATRDLIVQARKSHHCSFYAAVFVANSAQVTDAISADDKAMADVVALSASANDCSSANAATTKDMVSKFTTLAAKMNVRDLFNHDTMLVYANQSPAYSNLAASMATIAMKKNSECGVVSGKQKEIYDTVQHFNSLMPVLLISTTAISSVGEAAEATEPITLADFPNPSAYAEPGATATASRPYCVFYGESNGQRLYCKDYINANTLIMEYPKMVQELKSSQCCANPK